MKTALSFVLAATLPAAAHAAPPNPCEILTPEVINQIAERKVESFQQQKSGNPAQCGYLDSRKGAVLVVSIREVQYAVKDELFEERTQLEKIYKTKAKPLDTVGEGGYWQPANKQLGFRRNKMIVNITFSTAKNQNELDSSQIARVIDAKLGNK